MKSNSFKNGEERTDNHERSLTRVFDFYITRRLSQYLYSLLLLVVLPLVFCEPAVGAQARPPGRLPVSPSVNSKLARDKTVKIILRLNADASDPEAKTAHESLKNRLIFQKVKGMRRLGSQPLIAIEADQDALEILRNAPETLEIMEDTLSRPQLINSVPLIDADLAWVGGSNGAGFTIAIIDTGIDSAHPFFQNRVVHEACFSSTTSVSASLCPNGLDQQVGRGAAQPPFNIFPGSRHGTHVAGITAGFGGQNAISGVAPAANIISIQVFSVMRRDVDCDPPLDRAPCLRTYTSDQIEALDHVFGLRFNWRIASVNLSLGGGEFATACDGDPRKASIDRLLSVNIATVIAAGNDGSSVGISAPACISSAVAVGATDLSDRVASFSNSNNLVDVLAPGVSILSSTPNNNFQQLSGTSMATPHVAGAIAALRSITGRDFHVLDIVDAFEDSGVPITDARNNVVKPRIDVEDAMTLLMSRIRWDGLAQVIGDGPAVHRYPTLVGDVDGDGRSDLIFVGQGWSGAGLNIRVKRSNANGNWTSWSQVLGDGAAVHQYPTLVSDVDGDGRSDLIFVGQGWSGAGLNIRVKRSNGNGNWTSWSQVLGDGPAVHQYKTLVGDVDGDGRSDLIFVGQGWSGAGLNIRVYRSNGNGTWTGWAQVLGDGPGVHQYPTLVSDVDGDGRSDLIFVGQGWSGAGLNIRVYRSNGNGTWMGWSQVLGDGSGVHQYPTLIGDVDGDCKADLMFLGQDWNGAGLNVRVKGSNGSGTWSAFEQVLRDGPGVHQYRTLVGDVDGDGRSDLIFVGQNWDGSGLNIRVKRSEFPLRLSTACRKSF